MSGQPASPTGHVLRQAWDELLSHLLEDPDRRADTFLANGMDREAPGSYPDARFTRSNMRAANYQPSRYHGPKTQGAQRHKPTPATDILAPALATPSPSDPRPLGRRNRYPRDLK